MILEQMAIKERYNDFNRKNLYGIQLIPQFDKYQYKIISFKIYISQKGNKNIGFIKVFEEKLKEAREVVNELNKILEKEKKLK